MKIILFLFSIIIITSCAKPVCPEPVTTAVTITTKVPVWSVLKTEVTLQPGSEGKDAVINTAGRSLNYPSRTFLHARTWTLSGDTLLEKSLIQFDYSMIPSGAVITKAILTLFADTTLNVGSVGHSQLSGSNDWVLKRITKPWDEFTVTWNTEPATDSNSDIQCAASSSNSQAYVFDLTSWVADEIAHPASYHGFLMQINNSNPYRAINFCSSDHSYPSLRPKMVIEYTK